MQSRPGAETELGRGPGPRQVALDQGGTAAGGAGRAGERDRPCQPLGADDEDGPVVVQPRLQPDQGLEVGASQRPGPRGAGGGAGDLGQNGQLAAPAAHHIRSGAEIPSRPSAAAIVRFVQRQSAKRERSTPAPSAPTTWQSR